MTTLVTSQPGTAGVEGVDGRAQVADGFVIFGITGDLAKVMTFNSLYWLERRGLLDCPIVGVAVSPLLDQPPPVRPYAKGSWGPEASEDVVAGFGQWYHPWVAS